MIVECSSIEELKDALSVPRERFEVFRIVPHGGWLQGADLSGLDLSQTTFPYHSLLMGTSFEGSNLYRTRLSNCTLHKANFQGANLRYTLFISSDLTGARFDPAFYTSHRDTDFTRAMLEGTGIPYEGESCE